jgi:hypothetical protein
MNPSLVYLSGPISGLTFGECTDWREYVSRAFPPHIQGVSPLRAKRFLADKGKLEGAYEYPLATSRGINTRDLFDVRRSSVVLVNLLGCTKDNPKTKVSIGTVAEMVVAFDHHIPIVCAIEPDGLNIHEHPMLNEWIDYRVTSLDEAIEITTAVISPHEKYIWTNLPTVHILREENRLDLVSEPIHDTTSGFQTRAQ